MIHCREDAVFGRPFAAQKFRASESTEIPSQPLEIPQNIGELLWKGSPKTSGFLEKLDAGKRMIVLLDVEKILSRQELSQLSVAGV